jgi:universal stress protein A
MMHQIKKLLLATDFSECAEPATALAMDLAQTFGARLIIVCAYNAPLYFGALGELYLVPAEIVEKLRSEVERSLAQLSEEAASRGVGAVTMAVEGMAHDKIIDVARSEEIDLIVMGTHGRTGLHHLLLGSTAERVVRTAPCPVLTVRPRTSDRQDQPTERAKSVEPTSAVAQSVS